jgi:hypothetical protein
MIDMRTTSGVIRVTDLALERSLGVSAPRDDALCMFGVTKQVSCKLPQKAQIVLRE